MINNDVLRKFGIRYFNLEGGSLDSFITWSNRNILRIKLGFQGIGNRHLSLIDKSQVLRGYKVILDNYIFNSFSDRQNTHDEFSPKIFQIIASRNQGDETYKGILLGIGEGKDFLGDPNRSLRIGQTYDLGSLDNYSNIVIKLDSIGRYKKNDKRYPIE